MNRNQKTYKPQPTPPVQRHQIQTKLPQVLVKIEFW